MVEAKVVKKGKIFSGLKYRVAAVGVKIPGDDMINYLADHAEELFEPKRVIKSDDWLAENNEPGQTFKRYTQGGAGMNWVNPRNKTVYVMPIDESVSQE